MNSLYRLNRYCGKLKVYSFLNTMHASSIQFILLLFCSTSTHSPGLQRHQCRASCWRPATSCAMISCSLILAFLGCIAVLEAVEAFVLKHCPSYRLSAFSIFIFPSHSPQSLPCHSEASSQHFYACCYSTCKSIYSNCTFLQFQAATLLSHFCRQTEPRYQISTNAITSLYFSQASTAIATNLLLVPRLCHKNCSF